MKALRVRPQCRTIEILDIIDRTTPNSNPGNAGFYVTGGTLTPGTPSYVRRKADDELFDCLVAGEFCYVLDARQIGKSSLMVSTASRLRDSGVGSVILDLTSVGQNLTVDQWYFGMLVTVASQTGTEDGALDYWDDHSALGPMQRLMQCIRDVILPAAKRPLVIFVDEIDSVRSLRFSSDEFFAGIRECYNRRTEQPEYRNLTFCLLGVATPDDLIRNPSTTPFNIGKRITLGDFARDEASSLASGLGEGQTGQQLLDRIFYWTDGHPYLTQRLCKSVSQHPGKHVPQLVDELCNRLFLSQEGREHDDNLLFVKHRLLSGSTDTVRVLELYGRVLRGSVSVRAESPELLFDLLLSGAVKAAEGTMRVRNRLYGQVFNEAWVRANTPEAERKRQRTAFRRGLLRSSTVFGVFLMILAVVVVWALKQAALAKEQQKLAAERSSAYKHLLYQSRIGLAQRLLSSDPPRMEAAMQILRPYEAAGSGEELRGFEWGYLWRQAHPYTDRLYRGSSGAVAISALENGESFAEVSTDRVAIWSMGEAKVTQSLSIGPNDTSVSPSYSPKSRVLAFAMQNGNVGVYSLKTRGLQKLAVRDRAKLLVFSRDGAMLLVSGNTGKGAIIDLQKATQTQFRSPTEIVSATPTAAGFLLLSTNSVAILSSQGNLTVAALGISSPASSIAQSRDDRFILLAFKSGLLTLLDARTFAKIRSLETRLSDLVFGGFGSSGEAVAVARNGLAKVWLYERGSSYWSGRESLSGPTSSLTTDRRHLVQADLQGFVEVYDIAPEKDYKVDSPSTLNFALSVAANGRETYISSAEGTFLLADGELRISPLTAAGYSKNGNVLAQSKGDGSIEIIRGASVLFRFAVGTPVRRVEPSSDGSRLLTRDAAGELRIWDCRTGKVLTSQSNTTMNVGMSANGLQAFAKTGQGLRMWSGGAWEPLDSAKDATAVDLDPSGRYLAFVSESLLHVLDLGNPAGGFSAGRTDRTAVATCLAYSPDGTRLAEGANDGSIRVLDANSGETLLEFARSAIGDSVEAIAFAADGSLLVAGTRKGTIRAFAGFNAKLADQIEDFQSKLVRIAVPAAKD